MSDRSPRHGADPRNDHRAHAPRAGSAQGRAGVDRRVDCRVPPVLAPPPPAEAELPQTPPRVVCAVPQADAAAGLGVDSDDCARGHSPPRPADAYPDEASVVAGWESLLQAIRSGGHDLGGAGEQQPNAPEQPWWEYNLRTEFFAHKSSARLVRLCQSGSSTQETG